MGIDRRGVRTTPSASRSHSHADRARHHLGALVGALLLQVLEGAPAQVPDDRTARAAGAGRERRRRRHRPRLGRGLQDGEPQSPELHRALPGRGDRRGRHPARRLHHGRAADRAARRAALRRDRRAAHALPDRRRRARHRRPTATASASRRSAARPASTPPTTATFWSTPSRSGSPGASGSSRPRRPGVGNPILYVGSRTGRDGIHGATMASGSFDAESEKKRPTVQVGDPFTEKVLLEACLEAMRIGAIVAIQDMGAAGLTSSVFEMASRGGVGFRLDLDRVPLREPGLSAYEMMLSESQERMVIVAQRGSEEAITKVFSQVGPRGGDDRGDRRGGCGPRSATAAELEASMPIAPLTDQAPVYERPARAAGRPRAAPGRAGGAGTDRTRRRRCVSLLETPELASKEWIWRQYDHSVRTNTVVGPGGDAAVLLLKGITDGARADIGRQSGLLRPRPATGRPAGGRGGGAQSRLRRRGAGGAHRLPELRQPGESRDHVAVRGVRARHGRGLPRARRAGRLRQRLALQRDRGAARSCRRRRSRWWA